MITYDDARALDKLILEQAEWADATFGTPEESGPIPALKHIKKEADEAIEAVKEYIEHGTCGHAESKDAIQTEFADIFLLLLDASRRAGITFSQLIYDAYKKHQICRARTWNTPKWTYKFIPYTDGYACEATNGNEILQAHAETQLKAKIEVQKLIRAIDREPHEHDRQNDLPSNHC